VADRVSNASRLPAAAVVARLFDTFSNRTAWNNFFPCFNVEGEKMTSYSVSCKDSGLDCPGSFTTESKEELIEHVQLHARKAHGESNLSAEQVERMVKVASPV
jgi:predicted small metal-binding protein